GGLPEAEESAWRNRRLVASRGFERAALLAAVFAPGKSHPRPRKNPQPPFRLALRVDRARIASREKRRSSASEGPRRHAFRSCTHCERHEGLRHAPCAESMSDKQLDRPKAARNRTSRIGTAVEVTMRSSRSLVTRARAVAILRFLLTRRVSPRS